MTPPSAEVVKSRATYCLRCERLIVERWGDPSVPICAPCGLEAELFDREERLG